MSAPTSAYVIKDGNFLKTLTRQGSTLYPCYVARFLSGAHSQGGYSTTAAAMRENIKDLFYLDGIYDVRENGTTVGFVGYVTQGSANAGFHNLDTRGSGATLRQEAQANILLNDAGLNTMPYVTTGNLLSTFANVIVLQIDVTSAFYLMTDDVKWDLTTAGDNVLMTYDMGEVQKRITKSFRVGYWDASSNPTQQVTSGQSLKIKLYATNAEGTKSRVTTLTTQPRVLWEGGSGRPEWHYTTTAPTTVNDMKNAAAASVDIFESDVPKFDDLPGSSSGVAAQAPKFYAGPNADYPTMTSAAAAGWYWSPMLALYTDYDAWSLRAVYVDSTGTAKYYKALLDGRTQLVIRIEVKAAAVESDRPSDTYKTFTLTAEVVGTWFESYPTIRVRVGYVEGSATTGDGTVVTDINGNVVPHSTNIIGLSLNNNLTQTNKKFTKSFTQVYKSQALMNQYNGTRYYDAGNGAYIDFDKTKSSVVCLDSSGDEHPFQGDILWYGDSVHGNVSSGGMEVTPVG